MDESLPFFTKSVTPPVSCSNTVITSAMMTPLLSCGGGGSHVTSAAEGPRAFAAIPTGAANGTANEVTRN